MPTNFNFYTLVPRLLYFLLAFAPALAAHANPAFVRRSAAVPGEYIVVLPEQTSTSAVQGLAHSIAAAYNADVLEVWPYALRGFLISGSEAQAIAMSADPRVKFVEQNSLVSWIETQPAKPLWYGSYNFLLNEASSSVQDSGTVEQWVCVNDTNGIFAFYDQEPSCTGGTLSMYHYPANSSTDAKMLNWDEGLCE